MVHAMARPDVVPDGAGGLDLRAASAGERATARVTEGPWHGAAPVPADARADRVTSWLLIAAGVLGLVLVAVLAVRMATWDWLAAGDYGTIRLHTLDVGTSRTPLVGVYSRWGWNHPGPMLFYALAPFLRASGGDGHGLLLGALAVNAAAVAAALWVAGRAGRRALALTALTVVLLTVGLDPAGLVDAWNPYLLVLPLLAAALAAWRAALGDRVAAVVLVVAGSFAVQSHVLAGPPVVALLLVGAVGLGWRCGRGPDRRHDRWTAGLAAVVGLACWVPAIVQQLTGSPGNLGEIVDFVLHGDETPLGWAFGARVVGRALSLPPTWITGGLSREQHPVPWALFALVVATAWAWRRRWTSELVLCLTSLALVAAAFVGSARVTGVAYPYLFQWVWVVAAMAWLSVAAVVVAELGVRWSWARFVPAALAGGTVAVLLVLLVSGPDLSGLRRSDTPLRHVSDLVDPVLAAVREAPAPTLMTPTAYGIDTTLGIELAGRAEEQGIRLGFPSELGYVYGSSRTVDPADARSELVLAAGPARAQYAQDPRFRKVAEHDPLTPQEWSEFDRLSAVDWDSRPDGPTAPGPEYRRFQELSDRAFEAVTVYLSDQPPSTPQPADPPASSEPAGEQAPPG